METMKKGSHFDIPGLGKARMALTELSKNPVTKSNSLHDIKCHIVHELYVEIRAARIAGHSWKHITEAIKKDIQLPLGQAFVEQVFNEIDKRYEKETGVKALCNGDSKRGRRRRE